MELKMKNEERMKRNKKIFLAEIIIYFTYYMELVGDKSLLRLLNVHDSHFFPFSNEQEKLLNAVKLQSKYFHPAAIAGIFNHPLNYFIYLRTFFYYVSILL